MYHCIPVMVECMSEKLGNDTVNIGEDKAPPVMYAVVLVLLCVLIEDVSSQLHWFVSWRH